MTKNLLLLGLAVTMSIALGSDARADKSEDLSAKWSEALSDNTGDSGWLGKWLVSDRCGKKGFAACSHFGTLIDNKVPKWPSEFIADVLTIDPKRSDSLVCIRSWGCDLVPAALEMLAAGHQPKNKAIIEDFLTKHKKSWQEGAFKNWRPMFVRIIGWYGDRSMAPLVVELAKHKTGLNSDYSTVAAAAWLLSQWGDKSLMDDCKAVFQGDVINNRDAEPARDACMNYYIEFGDKSLNAIFRRYKPNNTRWRMVLAALGDTTKKADWAAEAKRLTSPTHGTRIELISALAALGDKKATKEALKGLKSGDGQLLEGYAKLLWPLRHTKYGKAAAKELKKSLKKAKATDGRSGRGMAFAAAYLLKLGHKEGLPVAKQLLMHDSSGYRKDMAMALAFAIRNTPVIGPESGLAGGVPVQGLGAIFSEAYPAESDRTVRRYMGVAWVMQKAAGGN